MGDSLSDLGEFGLIELLRRRLPAGPGVSVGVGDDAAAVATSALSLVSTDLLVEGIHFEFGLSSPADAGFKALAASVSDIAAMGGRAQYALVSLAAPAATPVATVRSIYDGILEAGECWGVSAVGGDLSSAPVLVLSVTVLGEAGAYVIRRGGAHEGDLLCVTGVLGASAAGLALLRGGLEDREVGLLRERFPNLIASYRRPQARSVEGQAAAAAGVSAMIDVSDGLAQDAGHLAGESGLGVRIHAGRVPTARGVKETASLFGKDGVVWALSGGEDYELAMAVAPERLEALRAALGPASVTVVGEFGGTDRVLIVGDERVPLAGLGWDHFS